MKEVREHLVGYPQNCGILVIRYVDGNIDRVNFKDSPTGQLNCGRYVNNIVLGTNKHLHINIGPTVVESPDEGWIGQVVVTDLQTNERIPIAEITLNGKMVFKGDIDNDFWIGHVITDYCNNETRVVHFDSNPGPTGTPYIDNGYRTLHISPPDLADDGGYDLKVVRRINGKGFYGEYPSHVKKIEIDGELVINTPIQQTLNLYHDVDRDQYLTKGGYPVTFLVKDLKPGILEECAFITERHRVYHYTDNAGLVWRLETFRDVLTHISFWDVDKALTAVTFDGSRHFELMEHLSISQSVQWTAKSENIVQ